MECYMKTLILILILSASALACGLPQPIYGTAPYRSLIIIESDGERIIKQVNIFGRFSFLVMPCSTYKVSMVNRKRMSVIVEPIDFEGKGVEIIFTASGRMYPAYIQQGLFLPRPLKSRR